ncbi:Hypothetical predicted protein [Xyrichtys novacula]|uniref:Uncharacterized protein n=1 Tax=Xyrichtys novacula TaxID=13765 RepID=A0AAV1HJ36_XYRNO|nr:Hypothetical predicted protein [Xyrichtys novacula]
MDVRVFLFVKKDEYTNERKREVAAAPHSSSFRKFSTNCHTGVNSHASGGSNSSDGTARPSCPETQNPPPAEAVRSGAASNISSCRARQPHQETGSQERGDDDVAILGWRMRPSIPCGTWSALVQLFSVLKERQ